MKRYELTDPQWELIEPLLPQRTATTGRPPKDPREKLNGILWCLCSGAPWRDVPERFGRWQTVYDYYRNWRDDGTFDRIVEALQIHLDRHGQIDWDLWCIDGSTIRATRAAAGATKKSLTQHPQEPEDHALGRSRGGFSSKIHLVTDGRGLPLAVEVTPGQRHESTQVEAVMNDIAIPQPLGRPRKRPRRLAGDKAYSSHSIREWLHAHRISGVIPRKSNERKGSHPFDQQSYRRRSVIEQCVGWLKECRRIGTRFEKLAISFMAMFKLAMIRRYLRLAFSDRA